MKCPTCSSEQWKCETTPQFEEVDGWKFKADLAAQVCRKCGEAIVALRELDRLEIEVALALALARIAAHSDDAIRTMRKAIGLSATALAELLK